MKAPIVIRVVILEIILILLGYFAYVKPKLKDIYSRVITVPVELPAQPVSSIWREEEIDCLARMVYGEARGEPFHGQVAVAAVAVNRSFSPLWNSDLCDIVREPKQFAGYWAASYPPHEAANPAWEAAYAASVRATEDYSGLPSSYRASYFFSVKGEASDFHASLPLKGYIENHAFYGVRK